MTGDMVGGRRLDDYGTVWQETPARGERLVGQVHTTAALRHTLVMCGRVIVKGERDAEVIRAAALTWLPETGQDHEVYQHVMTSKLHIAADG